MPLGSPSLVNPFHPYGRRVWINCWLPYAAWRFGVAPAMVRTAAARDVDAGAVLLLSADRLGLGAFQQLRA